ncbi:MAG TPA: hypothetical protein VMV18_12720 [bacterium]|nr:hypothetical protein [bacterium]
MAKKKPAPKKKAPAKKAAAPKKAAKAAKPARAAKPAKLAAKGKGPAPKGKAAAQKGNAKAAPTAAAPRKPSRQRVRICKQEGCSTPQTTGGFCRLHYLQNWKALKEEKAKRAQKNLDRYVERMAGVKKPAPEGEEGEAAEGTQKAEEAVFEEDFGEFVDVLSREENLDKILNGIKVEDY